MSVPKYHELYGAFIRALQDGEVHAIKEIKEAVIQEKHLTEDDLNEMLPSGRQTTFTNRLGWARTYLRKAGLIDSPARAKYTLTSTGRDAIPHADEIDDEYLKRYPSFRQFISNTDEDIPAEVVKEEKEQSPEELLESSFKQVNAALASELMDEVMKMSPQDFEKLVVKLLLKMGYGSGIDNAGVATRPSGDGGIDGIIKEDQLGFSSIYIQAKQWALDNTISRPEIQKFAGALQGEKASKGLFITTSRFTSGAKEYAENLHGSTIVLIDGDQLMKLMIKFNLGVSVQHTYEVKKIDTDFFNDYL
ncbi:MAG: restriction endonuclease [Bifidobacteriaceae bacterium]|jgi:restriction system protein|nr:restriction endonuclease [Bifidobacteriaceae bacterium]